jgi:hypothetical protein
MKIKLILAGLVAGLAVSSCASNCPKPTIIETPIAIQAKHIDLEPCPLLPIYNLLPTDTFDVRLKAWDATIVLLKGCVDSRDKIIQELNK